MDSAEIRQRMAAIDERLDSDNITDAEYSALDAEARQLTAMLPQIEQTEQLQALPEVEASEWLARFLVSFDAGTHVITNRQAECFCRVNHGQPFRYNGRSYAAFAPNHRAGFAHVVITKIG